MKRTNGHLIFCFAFLAISLPPATPADNERAQPIHLRGAKDLVIAGKAFGPWEGGRAKAGIILDHCTNITITGCTFLDLPSQGIEVNHSRGVQIVGNQFRNLGEDRPELAVKIYQSENVTVRGNRMERVASGAYVLESTAIDFSDNYVEDVLGPMPRGQMVQFDKVFGEQNRICGNTAVNHRQKSRAEDVISIYLSSGTAEDPILVEGNWISGDPESGSEDFSESGSGIMLGDAGGSHIICRGNTLISPGQVGIGVASGGDISVIANRILGQRSNRSNVGIYVWNQYPVPGGAIRIEENIVSWENAAGENNSFWQGGASQGSQFEFRSVRLWKNTWDAGDAILRDLPAQPHQSLPPPQEE